MLLRGADKQCCCGNEKFFTHSIPIVLELTSHQYSASHFVNFDGVDYGKSGVEKHVKKCSNFSGTPFHNYWSALENVSIGPRAQNTADIELIKLY